MSESTAIQQQVILAANELLAQCAHSKARLIEKLIEKALCNADDVIAAVGSMDIDYDQQAIRSVEERLRESPYTKKSLTDALVEYGKYTKQQALAAVSKTNLEP